MSLVSLICPQCGASLELDDKDRDYGFCPYCGCKVQLHEIISVKHSGSVTLDNSAQALNRIQIANRAFESHNFSEASSYYTKVLEDFPGNYTAIYRKGICAVYLSTPISLPTKEFEVAMKAAFQALTSSEQPNGKSSVDLIAQKDRDILELLKDCVLPYTPGNQKLPSVDHCNTCFSLFVTHAAFAATAVGFIDSEAVKEPALLDSINFCERAERTKLQYNAGTIVDKKGNVKENIGVCRLSGADKESIAKTKAHLAGQYNSLPSRLEREGNLNANIKILNDEIHALEKQIADEKKVLKAADTAFWKANPDLAKGRGKAALPGLIIAILSGIAFTLAIVFGWAIVILIAPVGIVLGILLAVSLGKKYRNSVYTEDIHTQINVINDDLKTLKEKKERLNTENSHLKEFNGSKK